MSEKKLKAGQVWVRGDKSRLVLWADGTIGVFAVEYRLSDGPHPVVKPMLGFIKLDELIRDGWSLDAEDCPETVEGQEVSDE